MWCAIIPILVQPSGVTLTWEIGHDEVRRANYCFICVPKPFWYALEGFGRPVQQWLGLYVLIYCIKTYFIQGANVHVFDLPIGVTLPWQMRHGEVRREPANGDKMLLNLHNMCGKALEDLYSNDWDYMCWFVESWHTQYEVLLFTCLTSILDWPWLSKGAMLR